MISDPRVPPSPLELGLEAMHQGRTADALHAFEQAYHLNSHDACLHEALGQLFFNTGDIRRARQYLEYAVHLAPESASARYHLALVALHEGRSQEAVKLMRNVLALDPEHEDARRALEAEEQRQRIAARLPLRQPRRSFGEQIVLRPPRRLSPYGQTRPVPIRAPHHCVNCYFRAGHDAARTYAWRYRFWNLGLVGMLFGGWPVYLIWTLAARERRFAFEPLYCSVCSSQRKMLSVGFWTFMGLASVFGFAGIIALLMLGAGLPFSDFIVGFAAVTVALSIGSIIFAFWCRVMVANQRGVRMRVVGEDEVAFSFASSQYADAFRQLNGAFIAEQPASRSESEAQSFVPDVEELADSAADGSQSAFVPQQSSDN